MSEKRVCRLHGHVLMQCRCPCPDKSKEMDCTKFCPQYGEPANDALTLHKVDLSLNRWKDLAERQEKELIELRSMFRKYWRCEVVASGYQSSSKCDPDNPHEGWGCCFVWGSLPFPDSDAKRLGLI